jgi:hypothetical protein
MAVNILPSITTSNRDITNIQLAELINLNLEQMGLFITGMNKQKERMEFLQYLKTIATNIEFPLVHVKIDSTPDELNFCLENFNTKFFNLHGDHSLDFQHSKIYSFREQMLAENSRDLTNKQMRNFSGICLDLSHYYEDEMKDKPRIEDIKNTIANHTIYCNHISAVRWGQNKFYSEHIGNYLTDFDYLKYIPAEYFSEYMFLELENTLTTQLSIIEYTKTIL